MIKDVIDKQFKVVKEYSGAHASVHYSLAAEAYILTVESTNTITDGFVHRCALDFGVNILNTRTSFSKEHTYFVEFPEG